MNPTNAQIAIFHATVLTPQLARKAYALVQMSTPSVELTTWIDHVRNCTKVRSGASGLTAIIDARSYIHGLFAWSSLNDPTYRKVLRISDIVLAELPGTLLQRAAFLSFRELAKSKGAGKVVILAQERIGALSRDLAIANGFVPAGELLEADGWQVVR